MHPSHGSVTGYLQQLQDGDRQVVHDLWQRYFARVVGLARKRLKGLPRRAADEEDVALSAFDSFCRAAEAGRFPRLNDRDDLWQVLVMITARKSCDLIEHERRARRDIARTRELPAQDEDREKSEGAAFVELVSREPDPAFAAELAEECQRLLESLGDELLTKIALRKMEGFTNEEIASQVGCARATIERKLDRIRKTWSREGKG